jgi:integrase
MSETLYQLLLKMPTRFNCAYVFTNGKTKKPYKCFNNTLWRKVLRNAGVKGLRWHDLRHTFGSRLRQRGVPLETIAELMGHKSLAMTLRYAHLDSAARSDAVRKLDQRPAVSQPADQPKAANQ